MKKFILIFLLGILLAVTLMAESENLKIGKDFLKEKDYISAEYHFLTALYENQDKEAYYYLAKVFNKNGKNELGKKFADLALENNDQRALNELGSYYRSIKNETLAEEYYKKSSEAGNYESLYNIAIVYFEQQN